MTLRIGPVLALAVSVTGCGSVNVDKRVHAYREQEAHELVVAYEQARAAGDLLTMCVKSNLISGAYADAEDPGNAQAWKARNTLDCRAARDALSPDRSAADR